MADRPHLGEATRETKERIVRALRAMQVALQTIGESPSIQLNAAVLLAVVIAMKEQVSLGQVLVLLRSDWGVLGGAPVTLRDAATAAREAGFKDLALEFEAQDPNAPQRPARELRGDLRTMRRRRN